MSPSATLEDSAEAPPDYSSAIYAPDLLAEAGGMIEDPVAVLEAADGSETEAEAVAYPVMPDIDTMSAQAFSSATAMAAEVFFFFFLFFFFLEILLLFRSRRIVVGLLRLILFPPLGCGKCAGAD